MRPPQLLPALIFGLLTLAACTQTTGQKEITNTTIQPLVPDNAVLCNHIAARGQMCMMLYQPVCGSNNQTYINGCTACKDESADYYVPDACPGQSIPNPYANLAFTECTGSRPQACTMDYNPVCGSVDNGIRCIRAPCPSTDNKTYSNGCVACSDPKVYGYWPGACLAKLST